MEDTIIDRHLNDSTPKVSMKTLLFLGMTLYLAVSGFGFFIETLLRDVFVLIDLSPCIDFFLNKSIALVFVFWMAYYVEKYAKKGLLTYQNCTKFLLRDFILLFMLSQVFQMLFNFFTPRLFTQNYFRNLSSCHDSLGAVDVCQYISIANYFTKYIIIDLGISRI